MISFFDREDALKFLDKQNRRTIDASCVDFLYSPENYKQAILNLIKQAKSHIYLIALYFENDEAGNSILEALYQAQLDKPNLKIKIIVDWHRAQRGRIGEKNALTNADWYHSMRLKYPECNIEFYGIPVNTREALGVLHFKGAIFDDKVLFSGASINNVYLHELEKYRFDRYHLITDLVLADLFVDYVQSYFLSHEAVKRLDELDRPRTQDFKKQIKSFRRQLTVSQFKLLPNDNAVGINNPVDIYPCVGLGNRNAFNKFIEMLLCVAENKITICTPYFNFPKSITKILRKLLKKNVSVKIIIGDKTANDFYIPETEPFRAIGALPYLYELNLIKFMKKNQKFIDEGLLSIDLWKDEDNTYHLKGIWIDNEWMLITGNNLNPRAWRLDLENGVLLHDKNQALMAQKQYELDNILKNTQTVEHFSQLDTIDQYPIKIKKLIRRVKRLRLDKIINRLL